MLSDINFYDGNLRSVWHCIIKYDKLQTDSLKESIKKWESIICGNEVDKGRTNCALCITFPLCIGCPVTYYTKEYDCDGTPYTKDWMPVVQKQIMDFRVIDITTRNAAQKELNFLNMLLKKTILFRKLEL